METGTFPAVEALEPALKKDFEDIEARLEAAYAVLDGFAMQ